jgi:hypothetical protein
LREFHLEAALRCACTARENVKDQLCPVDDFDLDKGFEIPLLRRGEFVVYNEDVGMRCRRQFLQLLNFPVPQQSGGVNRWTNLEDFCCNLGPGADRKFRKFTKRLGGGIGWSSATPFKTRQDCPFRMVLEGNRRL